MVPVLVADRRLDSSPPDSPGSVDPRPVLLATLAVRVDAAAERVAIECALETGARLVIANLLWLPAFPVTLMLAPQYATLPHEADLDAVRVTAYRAAEQGVTTALLRVSSRRPLTALVELVHELRPGLLVLGPDAGRTSRLSLWLATRRIRRLTDCLVWIVGDS